MQIVRMDVDKATALSGESILRVVFRGEGGECVTVDMADLDGGHDHDIAVDRAKTVLVQTATFSLAANEYEAESSGNFDEVAVTAASDGHGEVYLFEYRDGETSRRLPASRMPTLEAARAEAVRCAVDLLADLQPGTDDLSGWLVRVCDESGELLHTIDVPEAEAARRSGGDLIGAPLAV